METQLRNSSEQLTALEVYTLQSNPDVLNKRHQLENSKRKSRRRRKSSVLPKRNVPSVERLRVSNFERVPTATVSSTLRALTTRQTQLQEPYRIFKGRVKPPQGEQQLRVHAKLPKRGRLHNELLKIASILGYGRAWLIQH